MPRATECKLNDKTIGIERALQLRADRGRGERGVLDFRCIECGESVRAFKESRIGAAHFEHDRRNPKCRLSDPAR